MTLVAHLVCIQNKNVVLLITLHEKHDTIDKLKRN